MHDNISSEKDALYRVVPNDGDLIRNLHQLYDCVCDEPVPEYLMNLLQRLPL